MDALTTSDLSYKFSPQASVLNNVNLRVPEGSIYGFLGPNGAGKTTTLKLMLGLLRRQQGTVSVFGKSFGPNRIENLKKIGSLIETPSLYGHLSAMENLNLLRKIYGFPRQRMADMLKLVGLGETGKKQAGQFSLGMKQRLAIAIAMLNHPSLLILDEPTNGLDPNGIIEIRELLKKLNREQGITILISSHLLAEIERLVTHVGIIHKGNMMFQGTLEELVDLRQEGSTLILDTSDIPKALPIILRYQPNARLAEGKIIIPMIPKPLIAQINRQLVQDDIDVYGITENKNDLETIFIDLINN
jgi:lantibiotic transport system ATP-binding protein